MYDSLYSEWILTVVYAEPDMREQSLVLTTLYTKVRLQSDLTFRHVELWYQPPWNPGEGRNGSTQQVNEILKPSALHACEQPSAKPNCDPYNKTGPTDNNVLTFKYSAHGCIKAQSSFPLRQKKYWDTHTHMPLKIFDVQYRATKFSCQLIKV